MRAPWSLLIALCVQGAWGATSDSRPLTRAAGQASTPAARLTQHPGAVLPLDARAVDETGHAGTLGDFFDGRRPVLLVPGYYRCPQLCGLEMHALLESLQRSGAPGDGWRIVQFSIDAKDTPADARMRRETNLSYAGFLRMPPPDLRVLTASPRAISRVTRSLGFEFAPLEGEEAQFAHPATVVVATPKGVVSRYFNGRDIAPAELRVALADASGGGIGAITARLALICAHFDPRGGRYNDLVMNATRAACALVLAGVAALVLCKRRAHRGGWKDKAP
jgi:protein SCO1/2